MRQRIHPAIAIPLAVFVIAKTFAILIAIQGNCWSFGSFDCWGRWDSALYLDVAQHGHNLFYCGPEQGYTVTSTTDWCGNAGWAPLYPALMRLIYETTGISLQNAGLLLTNVFFLAFLLASAKLIDIKEFGIRNWLVLGIIAFCPGNIYFHAVFPLSMVAFLLTLFFLFLQKQKYLAAGVAAFFAVLTYSIGFFLIAALGIYGLYMLISRNKHFRRYALLTGMPALLGLIALFAYDYFSTGHWNALFLVQGKYGHSLHSPLKMFGQHWQRLISEPASIKSWIEIQNFTIVIYVLAMSVYLLRQKSLGAFRILHATYLFIFWFLPFSASLDVALYRNAAVLAPGHYGVKALPSWVLTAILIVFIGLSYPLGIMFIQSILV